MMHAWPLQARNDDYFTLQRQCDIEAGEVLVAAGETVLMRFEVD
jgi:hypothetical protein